MHFTILEQAEVEAKRSTKEGAAMKRAAIYCRVSTEDQEREGTSLQTQLEACREYCQGQGYEVAYHFSETYSGLTLNRPVLNELRELVRSGNIEAVVVFCLDRLSRDPTHGVIITQELEKHSVILEAVTEDVDSSELGKLISYIRGFASKLEAEKIRERTLRGKRARAREGRIPGGGAFRLYGYDYIKVGNENGGRRVVNEAEAKWVHQIYSWLVNEGISTSAITHRLRALNVPTKQNRMWCRAAVLNILKNPAYIGRTYVFTTVNGRPFKKDQSEWIEVEDATPAIIAPALFEAAQQQLQINRDKSPRHIKNKYLLRGHIRCRRCGRSYYGCLTKDRFNSVRKLTQRYRCSGKLRMVEPVNRCSNRSWKAVELEDMVWAKLQEYLNQPAIVFSQIEKQRQDASQLSVYETELQQVERQLSAVDREQHQLLQWALKGFPENQVESENKRLNKARETLTAHLSALKAQLKASEDAIISIPKIESFLERLRTRLATLDFEDKRQVLNMLDITVWLDGQYVEITGVVDPEDSAIVTTQS
jgi:site-specific DNA recombinase